MRACACVDVHVEKGSVAPQCHLEAKQCYLFLMASCVFVAKSFWLLIIGSLLPILCISIAILR